MLGLGGPVKEVNLIAKERKNTFLLKIIVVGWGKIANKFLGTLGDIML